jgi:DNA-binding FrmR family transcriptional regulator
MKADTKKDVAARLRSIAGHLKAVERMVDEDTYCVDVLKQTMAIEKALERVDAMVLASHTSRDLRRRLVPRRTSRQDDSGAHRDLQHRPQIGSRLPG